MPRGIYRRLHVPAKLRFWDKVKKTKMCWLWLAGKNLNGYGRFSPSYKMNVGSKLAHRFSFAAANPSAKMENIECIMHLCHTPACVRPSHLRAGTHKQNHAMRVERQAAARRNKSA